jgi:dihydrolipoamide dehydrogenase
MEYDVIVIGGGTAGLGAYRTAKSQGKKVLIIEGNDFVTTCANVGCMPSKLLIAAANNLSEIKKSEKFGIKIDNIKIDEEKLLDRVRKERDRFVGFVKEGAEQINKEDKVKGYAKFLNKNEIIVGDKIYKSKTFVIATGSRPIVPDIFKEIKDEILTNENIFEIKEIPKRLAVFGAGVIGLELGFAFKNLESEVYLFNKTNKLLGLKENINNYLVNHIKENMVFQYENEVEKIEKKNSEYIIYYKNETIKVDKILVTVGRKPNIDNIGLENVIKEQNILQMYNRKTTQLGIYPIFLAGDVNNDVTILHEASKEGVISGLNASNYPNIEEKSRNVGMSIIFSEPEIMKVGKTKDFNEEIVEGEVSFENQGRSRVMLKNKGLLNIYFSKREGLLLGAEMIGPDAEHIAHMLAWCIEKKTNVYEMIDFPFYHPVVEEGVRTAIRDAYSKIKR